MIETQGLLKCPESLNICGSARGILAVHPGEIRKKQRCDRDRDWGRVALFMTYYLYWQLLTKIKGNELV